MSFNSSIPDLSLNKIKFNSEAVNNINPSYDLLYISSNFISNIGLPYAVQDDTLESVLDLLPITVPVLFPNLETKTGAKN